MNMRWNSSRRTWFPVILCGITLALAYLVSRDMASHSAIPGFASSELQSISASESGQVAEILVSAGAEVQPGQVVARMNTDLFDAELDVVLAEIELLNAQVDAARSDARRQQAMDSQELFSNIDSTRVALSREEAALNAANDRLAILENEYQRLENLEKDQLVTSDAVAAAALERAQVAREVIERPHNIVALKAQLRNAEVLQTQVPGDYQTHLVTPLQYQLKVAKSKFQLLKQRKAALELRSPVEGRILAIARRPGENVNAGENILTLVPNLRSQVVACVSENAALSVFPSQSARVWSRVSGERVFSGRVIAVGPVVDQMPIRCRRVPSIPVWGREATIQLDGDAIILPGEAFDVTFGEDFEAKPEPVAIGVAPFSNPIEGAAIAQISSSQSSDPVAKRMDTHLLDGNRYNLEPSGIIYLPEISRYLVISDDPGRELGGKHSPVMFLMSPNGQIDAKPVPVVGVRELNDLESITRAENGTIYALTSQSLSRKGKRDPDRSQFFALRLEQNASAGPSLRLEMVGDFYSALARLSSSERAALGIRDLESLNIEGLAVQGTSLYLGLKAPLDAADQALIWKLDHPETFLASGDLTNAGLSFEGRVAVTAEVDRQTVPGGISDLLFLPDGRLLITSTPANTKEGSQTGLLWSVSLPPLGADRELEAKPERRFPGLKPEGLTLASHEGHVMVVFDTAGVDPRWLEIPWP